MRPKTFTTTASGFEYPLHYKIWGDDAHPTLVCVHGLTGNSQDFKYVGENLSSNGYRVVAVDMAGRGESSYYLNHNDYNFDQYLIDIQHLLRDIGCADENSCDWLGVSMGGLLGFRLAGQEKSPIRRMIVTDIGPEVPQADLDFISKIIKLVPEYNTPSDTIPILKMAIGTPYSRGQMSDEQWMHFATSALKQSDKGTYIRNYDPNIVHKFDSEPLGLENLWFYWEKTHQPTLSLRGALSTLFPLSIAESMKKRKPNNLFHIETISDAGHVPSLYRDDHITIIRDWLKNTQSDF